MTPSVKYTNMVIKIVESVLFLAKSVALLHSDISKRVSTKPNFFVTTVLHGQHSQTTQELTLTPKAWQC